MFSDDIDFIQDEVSAMLLRPAPSRFDLCDRPHALREAVGLLATDVESDPSAFRRVESAVTSLRERLYEKAIVPIAPLYVSSVCADHCLYCNFRHSNELNVTRLRLSDEELAAEVDFLVREGIRTIELVYASDPKIKVDSICRHVEQVRKQLEAAGGGAVGVNAEPLEQTEYRELKGSGVDFVLVWQETYDRARYAELHPGNTKKSSFAYRLDACERMLEAGIEVPGLGVLSGLSDWRQDWGMLFAHETYLRERFNLRTLITGLPRLMPAEGAAVRSTPFAPADRELLFCAYVQGLFQPYAIPFVSSRESWNWCVRAGVGGGALLTLNCRTIPGGYVRGTSGEQFPAFSHDARTYLPRLRESGFEVAQLRDLLKEASSDTTRDSRGTSRDSSGSRSR